MAWLRLPRRLVPILLAFAALAARPVAACEVRQAASVPIDTATPNLIVTVAVNGVPLPFILDTGSQRTILDAAAVARLGLPRDATAATTTRGIGGDDREPNVLPGTITLGGLPLRLRSISPLLSLPVGRLPFAPSPQGPIAGLLGTDLLAAYDLMLDGPARRLTLFDVRGCAGRFLPWAVAYTALPTIRPVRDMLLVPVRLDGRAVLAEIDSGAAMSTVLAPGMLRLGLTDARLGADPPAEARGVGPASVPMRLHRFNSMIIGGAVIPGPVLGVGPARSLRIVDMLLGADWLRQRLVWLSYATTQVFVAGP